MQNSRLQNSVEEQPLIRKWAGRQIHVDHNGEKLIAQMDQSNLHMVKDKIQFDFRKKKDNETNWISCNFNGG